MKKRDYSKSKERFHKFMDEHAAKHEGHFGSCNWEIEYDNFRLECWLVVGVRDPVIFQIFPDGHGFGIWQMTNEIGTALESLKQKVILSAAHAYSAYANFYADNIEEAKAFTDLSRETFESNEKELDAVINQILK